MSTVCVAYQLEYFRAEVSPRRRTDRRVPCDATTKQQQLQSILSADDLHVLPKDSRVSAFISCHPLPLARPVKIVS